MPTSKQAGFQPYPFFPGGGGMRDDFPQLGLSLATYSGDSPYIPGPPMRDCYHWRMTPTTLSLREYEFNVIANNNAWTNWTRLIFSYRDATNAYVVFANGTDIYSSAGNGAAGASLGTIYPGTDPLVRLYSVPFQNHILFNTYNNGIWWYNGTTNTSRKAGVTTPGAPTTATGAAGALTGTYLYVITYVNDRGHEGNQGTTSASVAPVAQKVSLTNIPTGPTGTSSRRIYRTVASGASFFFVATLADNVTTTYTDNTTDAALGNAIETNNNLPTDNAAHIAAMTTRVAILSSDGVTVSFSKIDATTGVPNWEAFPTAFTVTIPFAGGNDKGQAIVSFENDLYVFGRQNTYRIVGDIATGIVVEKILPDVGIFWPHSWCVVPGIGLVILDQNKRVIVIRGGGVAEELSGNIRGYLHKIQEIALNTNGTIGPSISFDAYENSIILEAAGMTTTTTTATTYIYSFATKEWTSSATNASVVHMSSSWGGLYMHTNIADTGNQDKDVIQGKWATVTEGGSAVYTPSPLGVVEWIPWSPLPGYDVDFGWIELIVEAKPIINSVVPMLKVDYALDGTHRYTSRYVDISRDYITTTAMGASPSGISRSVRIPIHRLGRTLQLRIAPAANTASTTNGNMIYGINIWARSTREGRGQANNRPFNL